MIKTVSDPGNGIQLSIARTILYKIIEVENKGTQNVACA